MPVLSAELSILVCMVYGGFVICVCRGWPF